MEDLGRIVVQWAHVLSGVLWIGGGFYTILVQLPALAAMPMPARGPALAALGPRQVRYVMRVAELTIATGILQIFVNPHAPRLTERTGLSSRWALAIVAGAVRAFVGVRDPARRARARDRAAPRDRPDGRAVTPRRRRSA